MSSYSVLNNDSDADGDSLTASLVSNVQHGTLSFSPNGTFTYTPTAGFLGTDTFTYKDYDGMEWSTVATATIAVTDSAPIAKNDSYTIATARPSRLNFHLHTASCTTTPMPTATR